MKQVKTDVEQVSVTNETLKNNRSLFVKVNTYNPEGREIGTRIVDMYHFGTRNWLHSHQWWAMHNNHTVEVRPADELEVDMYLVAQKEALAAKFNHEHQHVAA